MKSPEIYPGTQEEWDALPVPEKITMHFTGPNGKPVPYKAIPLRSFKRTEGQWLTQTIDQRARELLARQIEIGLWHDQAESVRAGFTAGDVPLVSALAALTEALTRIEELEAERNAGGFVGINSVMNEKLRDANETICEQRTRIEELEGALHTARHDFIRFRRGATNYNQQEGLWAAEKRCDQVLYRATLSKGITE